MLALAKSLHIVSPLLGLAVNSLSQIISFRLVPRLTLLPSIVFGFGVGLTTVVVTDIIILSCCGVSWNYSAGIMLANILAYGSLGYCYFHFINLGETARRVRLLRELYEFPAGLTEGELLKRYSAKDVLAYRLERLLHNHQIILKDDRLVIGNSSVLWMSRLIGFLKYLVLGKKSEFD